MGADEAQIMGIQSVIAMAEAGHWTEERFQEFIGNHMREILATEFPNTGDFLEVLYDTILSSWGKERLDEQLAATINDICRDQYDFRIGESGCAGRREMFCSSARMPKEMMG